MLKKILKNLSTRGRGGFDSGFYIAFYDDLRHLNSRQAFNHYLNFGRREGRFPNERSYLDSLSFDLKQEFDPIAYKFYNKDLANIFESDGQLFSHYVRHGRKEGRKSRFSAADISEGALESTEKWKSIFSVAEFLAWCGHELTELPNSREKALEIFWSMGVDRLWPINFKYAFDPDFVRRNHLMPGHQAKPDADLYRIWLTEGLPAGVAPNEQVFLSPFLGALPFPLAFDWQGFAQKSGMPRDSTRSQALVGLFKETTNVIVGSIIFMGADADWLLREIGDRALTQGDTRKAVELLTKSAAMAPSVATLSLLADAYRARGAMVKALETYLQSMDIGDAPMSAFLQAATIAASHQDYAQAFAILRRAFPLWRQKAEFGASLNEIVQLYFDRQSAEAHSLYRQAVSDISDTVSRQAADDLLFETLDHIQSIYAEMDSLPAPIGGSPDGYVTILANDDLPQCNHYRIEQKSLAFEEAGIQVKIFSHSDVAGFLNSLIGARAAIFYRVGAVPHILRAIIHANRMNLPTFYEIDDLIFDSTCYPDPFASFEGQISAIDYAGLQFGVPLFRYAMKSCRASIASTPALAERMKALAGHPVHVVRNGLDGRNGVAIQIGGSSVRREHGRVRIFYGSGTKAHNADFNDLVAPGLLALMTRYPEVDLVIVGHLKLRLDFAALNDRVMTFPFISDLNSYWSLLASCDINLAVLEPGSVADCKSEIKWLEAAVLQVPSVVSGTRTYAELIEDGRDGLIANSGAAWYQALDRLITQPKLRREIGAKAREKALAYYGLGTTAEKLRGIFGTVGSRSRGKAGALRVLVCNVFFAPQSYGGATRVVEENIKTFTTHYPDLELGIFCSDEGSRSPGQLRMDYEVGIPVYRLSISNDALSDSRPFNGEHASAFERVLDHFKPDLIHFHCIQRLTATIVEVALSRRIPYLVTLHDAWWLSDNQFLVDKNGFVESVDTDVFSSAFSGSLLRKVERRQRLASLLANASANLTVSASFAETYRSAGIDGLRVVENGTPSIGSSIRMSRADGRVALGHVGGASLHKGAHLIEASLRRGNFESLHLTMVDGALAPGQTVNAIWGKTPVTFVGPYAQSTIGELYSQIDVLLAPSIWPESFGLVTREALQAGLWIVASNRGAMGYDVRDGYDGYLIDVSTTDELGATLSKINAHPQRYRKSILLNGKKYRSMAEQAAVLREIYFEVAQFPHDLMKEERFQSFIDPDVQKS